jgi:hypothetical protein
MVYCLTPLWGAENALTNNEALSAIELSLTTDSIARVRFAHCNGSLHRLLLRFVDGTSQYVKHCICFMHMLLSVKRMLPGLSRQLASNGLRVD